MRLLWFFSYDFFYLCMYVLVSKWQVLTQHMYFTHTQCSATKMPNIKSISRKNISRGCYKLSCGIITLKFKMASKMFRHVGPLLLCRRPQLEVENAPIRYQYLASSKFQPIRIQCGTRTPLWCSGLYGRGGKKIFPSFPLRMYIQPKFRPFLYEINGRIILGTYTYIPAYFSTS